MHTDPQRGNRLQPKRSIEQLPYLEAKPLLEELPRPESGQNIVAINRASMYSQDNEIKGLFYMDRKPESFTAYGIFNCHD